VGEARGRARSRVTVRRLAMKYQAQPGTNLPRQVGRWWALPGGVAPPGGASAGQDLRGSQKSGPNAPKGLTPPTAPPGRGRAGRRRRARSRRRGGRLRPAGRGQGWAGGLARGERVEAERTSRGEEPRPSRFQKPRRSELLDDSPNLKGRCISIHVVRDQVPDHLLLRQRLMERIEPRATSEPI
jgi:hypothetical protein